MQLPLYQVDAFTNQVFGGNPAAVCILDRWPNDGLLQSIAAENNLSETAFIIRRVDGLYQLRWFTPALEVDLCGHATLASAYVIFTYLEPERSAVTFETASGELTVNRSDGLLSMDFPAWQATPYGDTDLLVQALDATPLEVFKNRDIMAVFETESDIKALNPNMETLLKIKDTLGLIVTAPGDGSDFVSRFFAPWAGIAEDPVTGSAHCTLTPYWSRRLDKSRLHTYQISPRRGELFCEDLGERVRIAGHAVLYSEGTIDL